MTRRLVPFLLAGAALLITIPSSARAQLASSTSSLTVTANVVSSCAITTPTPTLAFGAYSGVQIDTSTPLTVRCNVDTDYWVNVGFSLNALGAQRRMVDVATSTTYLSYGLYRDAGRTVDWTDGVPVAGVGAYWVTATGGVDSTVTIFGRLNANQPVTTGAYSDTMSLTVFF